VNRDYELPVPYGSGALEPPDEPSDAEAAEWAAEAEADARMMQKEGN